MPVETDQTDLSVSPSDLQEVARLRFANMLRALFPEASDAEVARACAAYLGCSPKTVERWLALETGASFEAVFALGCRFGVFRTAELLTLGQSRHSVMALIGRRVFRARR
ncbi:hypothetical protein [Palleronia caenipelagi]|uniref:Helix-turn-helix domain-containing protein n=1 Tax=Palleronia caenipelagi TaxID=2489174 RepID=A0A547PS16_9RHOB|nr:hypothetical protein [Palleronia caenipelagi]TRD16942.1 hypothetical protein FEV53_13465 [Palleronia caenipelagi]